MAGAIIVVGSLNMDLVVRAPRLPLAGETITGSVFNTVPGGKGANQAVAAARLGAAVRMIGCVGEDAFGSALRASLEREGIDAAAVKRVSGVASGTASITVLPDGENTIVVAPGANAYMDAAAIEAASFADAAAVLAQLEIPMGANIAAAERARECGVPFFLDPAPASPLPDALLRNTTWLTPNESEAVALLRDTGAPSVERVDTSTARDVGAHLLSLGVRNVALKMGAAGVYVAGQDVTSPTMVPGFPVRAVDTTAAGDAFNGAFAVALAGGQDPAAAARFAAAAAAVSVTREGAQPSIATRDEVYAMLQQFA